MYIFRSCMCHTRTHWFGCSRANDAWIMAICTLFVVFSVRCNHIEWKWKTCLSFVVRLLFFVCVSVIMLLGANWMSESFWNRLDAALLPLPYRKKRGLACECMWKTRAVVCVYVSSGKGIIVCRSRCGQESHVSRSKLSNWWDLTSICLSSGLGEKKDIIRVELLAISHGKIDFST